MKSFAYFRNLVSTMRLAAVLGTATAAWSAPVINSIEVVPTPLRIGTPFSINVAASPDVTQGTATLDFRPAAPSVLRVALTKQGNLWTGSGIVPLMVPAGTQAAVKAILLDANRQRTEQTVQIPVIETAGITASFNNGILTVTGDDSANEITVSPGGISEIVVNGGAVNIMGGTPTTANTTLIRILGDGGNDILSVIGGALPKAEIHGGDGDDTINGGAAADECHGGPGNDWINGRGGNDLAFCGPGNDTFVWDPGDGNDTIEGQDGEDRLLFNGSAANENIDIFANGARLQFFRNVANILMDCDDVEIIDFNALGGADNIVVGTLNGTDALTIGLNLAGPNDPELGDGQADSVIVNGTQGDDVIAIAGSQDTGVAVFGIQAVVTILAAEQANDRLTINALGGADVVNGTSLPFEAIALTINGGLGDDVLLGSDGDDLANGGDGDDTFLAGGGNDTFVWNPGDDNDTIEGQAGQDRLLFNGAAAAENIDLSANGGRLIFFRDIANVFMDCNDLEVVDFNALGGADTIVVNDLTGTDVTAVGLNLAVAGGAGDGQPDNVVLFGTNGDDLALFSGSADGVAVFGLSSLVTILGSEGANDRLTVNLLAADDVLDASALPAGLINLIGNGGEDNDVLVGSEGSDTLQGAGGDDVLLGGPGTDILDGGSGDNVVIQD